MGKSIEVEGTGTLTLARRAKLARQPKRYGKQEPENQHRRDVYEAAAQMQLKGPTISESIVGARAQRKGYRGVQELKLRA